jgi:hypothetical protein
MQRDPAAFLRLIVLGSRRLLTPITAAAPSQRKFSGAPASFTPRRASSHEASPDDHETADPPAGIDASREQIAGTGNIAETENARAHSELRLVKLRSAAICNFLCCLLLRFPCD